MGRSLRKRAARALGLAWLAGAASILLIAPSALGRLEIHVRGNQLIDGRGHTLRLFGVARSGAEYACSSPNDGGYGYAIFDDDVSSASIAALRRWHVNAVQLPLNEQCWLGVNGIRRAYSGERYRRAVAGYVSRLHRAGIYVILDLHQSAPGKRVARFLQPMPDADHAPAFWRSLARRFAGDPAVVFDLYSEPHDVGWRCWRDGCSMRRVQVDEGSDGEPIEGALRWRAAGMGSLLNAVRSTGTRQPIMIGGLEWSNDLARWRRYTPRDPRHQLAASFHLYNDNACATPACWDATIARVAAHVPLITGELGEYDCAHTFIDRYMAWADARSLSYLAWTWNTGGGWTCTGGPSLIADYDGTPTAFGTGFRDHLAALVAARQLRP